jgi:hypothetical protein
VGDYDDWGLLPKTLFIAFLIQLGVFITQRISVFIHSGQKQLATAATLTMTGLSAATILFTLPLGLDDLTSFGEGYWKFAIAVILFTGLMLSITSLIVWAFRRNDTGQNVVMATQSASAPPRYPVAKQQQPATSFEPSATSNQIVADDSPEWKDSAPSQPVQHNPNAPQFAAPVATALPWPVFPNGQPLPPRSNGRPDFKALKTLAEFYAESEQKFFD